MRKKERASSLCSMKRSGPALLMAVLLLFTATGCMEDETEYTYTAAEQSNLTQLTHELANGGDSLTDNYSGDGIWGVEQDIDGLRDYYTSVEDAESVTFMVYMIGSNLESDDGSATADIAEMLASDNGDTLNIVLETGGAEYWEDERISPDYRQRWLVQDGELMLEDQLPVESMCTRSSLSDFVRWSADNYPADRYMLVLWDHGGGTMMGYGSDEFFPDDTLSLADMAGAVADSGVKLDIMSFDACLMGTLETAYAFEPVADYLLASEESEPGDGWYYTDALNALSEDPSMPTVEFGARIIDDYAAFYKNSIADLYGWDDPDEDDEADMDYEARALTLSLVNLREVPQLYQNCLAYYRNAEQLLTEGGEDAFTALSYARSASRSYGDGEYEQIDLVDYVQRTGVDGAEELIRSALSAVKYRNDSSLEGSFGTAVYFPYSSPEYYSDVMSQLAQTDYVGGQSFYDAFLSIMVNSPGGNEFAYAEPTNDDDLLSETWFEDFFSEDYDYQTIDNPDELTVNYSDRYDAYLLTLSDEEWESIIDVQLQVMLDDGEGYIDLGSDQQFDWTKEGDLILDFDDSWVSIDGQLVAFYAAEPVQDGDNVLFTGTVPALLNDDTVIDLYLRWRQDGNGNTRACVLGYIPTEEETRPKGYLTLKEGDELQFLCDYYTYDGAYDDQYALGDPITVTDQNDLTVEWLDLEDSTVVCNLRLTDWYNQYWYTEAIEISFE